jgi:glycosyltransferase involved in cell wall biosynthesis
LSKQEARARLGWPQEKMIFFSVRQLRPRYGIDVAINAFSQLQQQNNFQYYIAGQGQLRSVLESQIRASGLTGQVHLMGRISDRVLTLAYQAADIFVLPTKALECFGLIILESLAWGCPLIATDAGAIPEVLGRVLPNHTIPAGDVRALRDKLITALAGRLYSPAPDELITLTSQVYGKLNVVPRIEKLLTGAAH